MDEQKENKRGMCVAEGCGRVAVRTGGYCLDHYRQEDDKLMDALVGKSFTGQAEEVVVAEADDDEDDVVEEDGEVEDGEEVVW